MAGTARPLNLVTTPVPQSRETFARQLSPPCDSMTTSQVKPLAAIRSACCLTLDGTEQ